MTSTTMEHDMYARKSTPKDANLEGLNFEITMLYYYYFR